MVLDQKGSKTDQEIEIRWPFLKRLLTVAEASSYFATLQDQPIHQLRYSQPIRAYFLFKVFF